MKLINADALSDEMAVLFERNEKLINPLLAGRIEDLIDKQPAVPALLIDLSPLEDVKQLPAFEKSLEWHLQHKAFGFLDPIAEAFEALTDEDPEEAD